MENKQDELVKYKDLVLATIDYLIALYDQTSSSLFDPSSGLKELKIQTISHFNKGNLSILKRWFKDISEPMRETKDLNFQPYIEQKTGFKIDIFKQHFDYVEKIIQKGKITTDNQFREVNAFVDYLVQTDPIDTSKIEKLNSLLLNYEELKAKKTKNIKQ